jgi:hypothetical protein
MRVFYIYRGGSAFVATGLHFFNEIATTYIMHIHIYDILVSFSIQIRLILAPLKVDIVVIGIIINLHMAHINQQELSYEFF